MSSNTRLHHLNAIDMFSARKYMQLPTNRKAIS